MRDTASSHRDRRQGDEKEEPDMLDDHAAHAFQGRHSGHARVRPLI
jgi:hypothetical protein